jgi:hypothetical protein
MQHGRQPPRDGPHHAPAPTVDNAGAVVTGASWQVDHIRFTSVLKEEGSRVPGDSAAASGVGGGDHHGRDV